MTRRLYDEDAYCSVFKATVLSCHPCDKGYEVVLDQSAFFPEGGGQPSDPGTLNGIPVNDVQMVDNVIHHYLSQPLPVDSIVTGALDFDVRFSRMQKHTGEHIVSGLVFQQHGYVNCGFHLGSEDVTLDFDGELTREQLDEIETKANRIIWANVDVTAGYPSPEELATLSYRSKLPIDGPVRIVTIDGCDVCACCAPHVAKTGEIGALKLLDTIRYKGGVRIHMQCGEDALLDYRDRYRQTAAIASMLSVKQRDALSAVKRLSVHCEELERELKQTQLQLAVALAEHVPSTDSPTCLFLDCRAPEAVRKAAATLSVRCQGPCAVFAGTDAEGYRFVSMGEASMLLLERMKAELSARGGGNAEAVQGSVMAARSQIEAFFRNMLM